MMERKLEEYRAAKRKEAFIASAKESLKSMFAGGSNTATPCSSPSPWTSPLTSPEKFRQEELSDRSDDAAQHLLAHEDPNMSTVEEEIEAGCSSPSWLTITLYGLYTLLWATLMGIAVQLEFGAVFFILSLLVIIWINTSTRPKKQGEPSAYSVFNRNCESIDGTLTAEQFEAELRYGALH